VAVRPPRVDPDAWRDMRRLLCVRLDGMGDLLMTEPAIRALRSTPDGVRRHVTLWTSPAGAAIAPLLPLVDDVVVWDAPWTPAGNDADDDMAMIERLRAGGFDAAVVFTVETQSALPAAVYCRLAGIPRRATRTRENPYGVLTDWLPEGDAPAHEVLRQLSLATSLGGAVTDDRIAVAVPASAEAEATSALAAAGVDPDDRWLVVHPGAVASSRRYPAEGFAAAADLLAQRGWRVVLTGTAADHPQLDAMRRAMRSSPADIADRLDAPAFAALLSAAPVVVTNNTGAAHLAAAVGSPVVDLYALTNLQHTPWRTESRVLFRDVPCRGCLSSVCLTDHHWCLRGVDPAEIVEAVDALVHAAPRKEEAWPLSSV
jgi:ADP-heptose:LPS heptosyltransferase